MKTRRLIVAVLTLCAVAAAAEPQTHFKVYKLPFSDVAKIGAIAKSLVSENGKVVVDADGKRLIVLATAEQHAQIAGLVKELNVPPRNVRIVVRFLDTATQTESAFGVRGSGGVLITERGTHGRLKLKPQLKHQRTDMSSNVQQTLMVASGREGAIHIGKKVPYLEYFVQWGHRYGYFEGQVAWQSVGSRLVVTPTVIGDGPLISVKLTPELSGLVDGDPFRVRFTQAATDVTVSNGQTINIGGLGSNADFYNKFLVGYDSAGNVRSLNITLTAQILDPAGMPAGSR